MFSLSEENYLKAIFHLERSYPTGVSTNALAEEMSTKASSVTDMIKRLSEKKLVAYKKYQGVKLSKFGRETAVEVIRKHRLWEVFLVDKLGFAWDEVHEVAEQVKDEKLNNVQNWAAVQEEFSRGLAPAKPQMFHSYDKIVLCRAHHGGKLVEKF
jgi:DtxR family Mn-dependent transcriptional regulator